MKSLTSMRLFKLISVSLLTLSLSGCAGIFIAGAATTANLVTDTRTTKQIWNDNNIDQSQPSPTNSHIVATFASQPKLLPRFSCIDGCESTDSERVLKAKPKK